MKTRVLRAQREADLREAAEVLIAGGLLAFPTETVYGLGARADLPEAVQRLLEVKGRPPEKKMAVLVTGPRDMARYAVQVPEAAHRLAARWWPGPVTIVLDDPAGETVGLRCPDLPYLRRVVGWTGAPVYAPSANPTDEPPALDADEVLAYFDGRIEAVLDGGPVRVGRASTVVRVKAGAVEVLREGAVSADEIAKTAKGKD